MQDPEDVLFRTVFGNPEAAAVLLRYALPTQIERHIDWRTITPAPHAMVSGGVLPGGPHTDLLVTAKLREQPGEVYFLLERRAEASCRAVVEVLGVVLRIWDRFRRLHPGAKVPAVVAVVVHHGAQPWNAPTSLHDSYALTGLPADVLEDVQLAAFQFVLFDLAATSETELLEGPTGGRGLG